MTYQDALNLTRQQIDLNNSWSAEQAQKQMDFQREMSNTAITREVEDMKNAGINPVLSAKLGGASTPNGAMAQSDPSATSALTSIVEKMLDIEETKAVGNIYSGYGSYHADKETNGYGLTDGQTGGLLQFFLGGNGGKEGREGLGILFNKAVENFGKFFNGVSKWYKGEKTGNNFVDNTTAKINEAIPDPREIFTNAVNTAKNAWNNTAPTRQAAWNNITNAWNNTKNAWSAYGSWYGTRNKNAKAINKTRLPIFSDTPPISYTPKGEPYYRPKFKKGLTGDKVKGYIRNYGNSIYNPRSSEFNKFASRVAKNKETPYQQYKRSYDPYKRYGNGRPRTKQKQ